MNRIGSKPTSAMSHCNRTVIRDPIKTHQHAIAILPTPRVYARFPFFNEMNNVDAFGELMLRPTKTKRMAIRSDIHGLWLANRNDLWYSGGGAFQPWSFGFNGRPSNGARGLATLYDASWDYQATRNLGLGLYFAYARGGDVVQKIHSRSQFHDGIRRSKLPVLSPIRFTYVPC
jgi:hypothetical protein